MYCMQPTPIKFLQQKKILNSNSHSRINDVTGAVGTCVRRMLLGQDEVLERDGFDDL